MIGRDASIIRRQPVNQVPVFERPCGRAVNEQQHLTSALVHVVDAAGRELEVARPEGLGVAIEPSGLRKRDGVGHARMRDGRSMILKAANEVRF